MLIVDIVDHKTLSSIAMPIRAQIIGDLLKLSEALRQVDTSVGQYARMLCMPYPFEADLWVSAVIQVQVVDSRSPINHYHYIVLARIQNTAQLDALFFGVGSLDPPDSFGLLHGYYHSRPTIVVAFPEKLAILLE